jgi:Resolvase, N terminal domain
MTTTLIGYARCSTDKQDLAAQKAALEQLGVAADRIYTDHGLTGTNRSRPGLDQALAAVRTGDTLVVPKLDRLARSVPDARFIVDALVARGVRLALGSSVYDPVDPMGKMFFNILATLGIMRSATWPSYSRSRARPCTGPWPGSDQQHDADRPMPRFRAGPRSRKLAEIAPNATPVTCASF